MFLGVFKIFMLVCLILGEIALSILRSEWFAFYCLICWLNVMEYNEDKYVNQVLVNGRWLINRLTFSSVAAACSPMLVSLIIRNTVELIFGRHQ